MRWVLVPLDERPCNYRMPVSIGELGGGVVVVPPLALMGHRRVAAAVNGIADWIETQLASAPDALCLCLDTLLLGGLIPSRLDTGINVDDARTRLGRLRRWKDRYPRLRIVAHMAVQRVSESNDASEERPYWDRYGRLLAWYGMLEDRIEAGAGDERARSALAALRDLVPEAVRRDYEAGRARNHALNLAAMDLAADGVVDVLLLTQDDTAPWGYAAREARALAARQRDDPRLMERVHIYPGADEVGSVMVARTLLAHRKTAPTMQVVYSSPAGPRLVPRYEDRPQEAGIRAQADAVGVRIVDDESADIGLFVNTPGQRQGEAPEQADPAVRNGRDLEAFCARMAGLGAKSVLALADVAYANGGDSDLIESLTRFLLWPRVDVYSGWNTSGNTVGTAIAAAAVMAAAGARGTVAGERFLLERFLDDWFYQAELRQTLAGREPRPTDASRREATAALRERAEWLLSQRGRRFRLRDLSLTWPWDRWFEIALTLDVMPARDSVN
jgi:hypothetical protein